MIDDVLFRHKLGLFEMNSGPSGTITEEETRKETL